MIATEFYQVDASVIYDDGISYLVKKYDGAAVDNVEPKSADFHVTVDPPGCVDKVCTFPGIFKEDDYLTIIYNNALESKAGLQALNDSTGCYFLPVAVAGGVEYNYVQNVAEDIEITHPELSMDYNGVSEFTSTILSDEFFRSEKSDNPVPVDEQIELIKIRFRKTVFGGAISDFSELEFQCED